MNKIHRTVLCAAFALVASMPLAATDHYGKLVGQLFGPDYRDCFFFTLQGVGQADPVTPGNHWFAVPSSHLGFKELFSLIMSQRLAGQTVNVTTTGTVACGLAEVRSVWTD
jgi:hypothetical protein